MYFDGEKRLDTISEN